jgi:hypothetical protein
MDMVQSASSIPITTRYTRYGREYNAVIEFTIWKGSVKPEGWLEGMLRRMSAQSLLQPYGHAEMVMLRRAIDLGQSVDFARKIFTSPARDVSRSDLFHLFDEIGSYAEKSKIAKTVQVRMLIELRGRVIQFGETGAFLEQVTKSTMRYKRQRPQRPRPRPIISDMVQPDGAYNDRAPVSALSHNSLKDLEANALRRIGADSEKVIEACISDLSFWRTMRVNLDLLSKKKLSLSKRTAEAFDSLARNSHPSRWATDEAMSVASEDRIIAYLHRIKHFQLATPQKSQQFAFYKAKDALFSIYPQLSDRGGVEPFKILFLTRRICSHELIAIFILLMFYTGWNMSGVVNLTSDHIIKTKNGYEIQGFKSKSDDDTPIVFIDKTHRGGFQALELILWNLDQLKELGRVKKDETRLWFTYSSGESLPYTHQYVGFQGALAKFCRRHGLVRFTFEQIRAQVLMGHFLSTRDPERARQVAGHKTIATTGVYIDQEFARRLNSANNLEFQRRFEATVKFKLKEEGRNHGTRPDVQFVDANLMIPVGDGTTCANPAKPPDPTYLEGEFCDGKRCHIAGGCRNQRIVLDEARLKELTLKRRYYRDSWQRLLQANGDAFHTFHVPTMFFTFALYMYVKEGPYGHALNRIEREIDNELP